MGKIITIANHKGGVGKTTTVLSLGTALSRMKKKVLIIDLDAQCNLTAELGVLGTKDSSIFDSFVSNTVLQVIHITKNMDLVPGSLDMVGIEKALTVLVQDQTRELQVLKEKLDSLKSDYDYILLDCPPSLGIVTKNALVASDGVIICLTAESLPTLGLQNLEDAIYKVRGGLNTSLSLYGILITRYNRRKLNKIVEEVLRERYGDLVFKTKIRENVDLMEAPLYQKTIYDYAPESNGAKDYQDLAKEILTNEKKKAK